MRLNRNETGLLIIDVQEKLFPKVDRPCEVMQKMQTALSLFRALKLPVVVTEQYPQALGSTMAGLREKLDPNQEFLTKTSFSCLGDLAIREKILKMPVSHWVVVGIEAHVCIFQTVRDLLEAGKHVVVLNDAITSRSIYDFSTAIAEMRDCGARISSTETVAFELVGDAGTAEFKMLLELIK